MRMPVEVFNEIEWGMIIALLLIFWLGVNSFIINRSFAELKVLLVIALVFSAAELIMFAAHNASDDLSTLVAVWALSPGLILIAWLIVGKLNFIDGIFQLYRTAIADAEKVIDEENIWGKYIFWGVSIITLVFLLAYYLLMQEY